MAKWKPFDLTWGRSIYYCTECKEGIEVPTSCGKPMYRFCPMCGARMNTADTPQTDCENCAHWEHGAGQHYYCALLEMRQECCFESKDESTLMFANVPQTDCGWK